MSIFLLFIFFFPLFSLWQNYFCTNDNGPGNSSVESEGCPAPGDIFQKPPPTVPSSELSLMNADPSSSPPFQNNEPEEQNKRVQD